MPVQLFTEAERARRNRFPEVIAYEDLVTFFTLSERDLQQYAALAVTPTIASAMPCNSVHCASWALSPMTSAVRPPKPWPLSPTSSPSSPTSSPPMARGRKPGKIICTPSRPIWAIARSAGTTSTPSPIGSWSGRLEHDKPTLLYELACEKLRTEQLLRPGVTRLERLVAEARERAQTETFRQLTPILTDDSPAVAGYPAGTRPGAGLDTR